jgi:hypothetical protein
MDTNSAFFQQFKHAGGQVGQCRHACALPKDPNRAKKGQIWLSVINVRSHAFVQIHGLNIGMHFNPISLCTAFLNPIPGF